jgi:cytochrome b561
MATTWKLSRRSRREGIWRAILANGALPWLVAASLGVLGLLDMRPRHFGWVNAPAAFGIVLCMFVTARFVLQLQGGLVTSWGVHALVRGLSREVYVILYVFVAIKAIQYLFGAAPTPFETHAGPLHAASSAYDPLARSMEGLQGYLASGIIALVVLRILAVLYLARRQRRGLAARCEQPRIRW